jgi:hypothetical protein
MKFSSSDGAAVVDVDLSRHKVVSDFFGSTETVSLPTLCNMMTESGLLYYDLDHVLVLECINSFCIQWPSDGEVSILCGDWPSIIKLVFHPTYGVKCMWPNGEELSLAVFVAVYGMITALFQFPDGTAEKGLASKLLLALHQTPHDDASL